MSILSRLPSVDVAQYSPKAKRTLGSISAAVAAWLIAGCSSSSPESDQIAQRWLIGRSEATITTCLGKPARREAFDDATEIWTYRIGAMRGNGPIADLVDSSAGPSRSGSDACNVKFVMTKGRVSQVAYSSANGIDLPLESRCEFTVAQCVTGP